MQMSLLCLCYFLKMSPVPVEVIVPQCRRKLFLGPISMCMYTAPISAFILEPLQRNLNETKSWALLPSWEQNNFSFNADLVPNAAYQICGIKSRANWEEKEEKLMLGGIFLKFANDRNISMGKCFPTGFFVWQGRKHPGLFSPDILLVAKWVVCVSGLQLELCCVLLIPVTLAESEVHLHFHLSDPTFGPGHLISSQGHSARVKNVPLQLDSLCPEGKLQAEFPVAVWRNGVVTEAP